MATSHVGSIAENWDEALSRLIHLSRLILTQNLNYEVRVAELEQELDIYRRAHSVLVDTSDRRTIEEQARVVNFSRQISTPDHTNGNVGISQPSPPPDILPSHQRPLILCIINGEEIFFKPHLIQQGYTGGRSAGQLITRTLEDFFTEVGMPNVFGHVSLWVTLYFKKGELMNTIANKRVCTLDKLDSFLAGFTQTSPRFTTVDVGGREKTDVKIDEYLQTFIRFSQTLRVILAGCHNMKYLQTYDTLQAEGLLGKLITLHGPGEESLAPHNILSLTTEGLVALQNLPSVANRSSIPVGSSNTVTVNAGLISPQSPARGGRQLVDANLPLHKHRPPPCNEYYLMASCSKEGLAGIRMIMFSTQTSLSRWRSAPRKLPVIGSREAYPARLENGAAGDIPALMGATAPMPPMANAGSGERDVKDYGAGLFTPASTLPVSMYIAFIAPMGIISSRSIVSINLQHPHIVPQSSFAMSSHDEDHEDLRPTNTPGYNPSAAKTLQEYQKLDEGDPSLTKWKESLGITAGASTAGSGPKVTVLTLELMSATMPAGKSIVLDVNNAAQLEDTKKNPIIIKEGVEYNVRITFKVNHSIISGVRYIQVVKRAGLKVDKLEQMLGSYGPHPKGEAYFKNFDPEESPSGMLARSGNYTVKSRVIDDDGNIYADFEWVFKLAKEW
ncbi:hypothetical protein D9758_001194 [Tetrapyrgos nigripes]|uniref:DUF7923 domain-containing protein n=1 Tax=Tetrapyrgos nigripes TaxID=182062 RepID=A0A8H5GRP1_9AGAR|nr:hypothetical protein D9758_001194 [Tetrapyrgos nigripes]